MTRALKDCRIRLTRILPRFCPDLLKNSELTKMCQMFVLLCMQFTAVSSKQTQSSTSQAMRCTLLETRRKHPQAIIAQNQKVDKQIEELINCDDKNTIRAPSFSIAIWHRSTRLDPRKDKTRTKLLNPSIPKAKLGNKFSRNFRNITMLTFSNRFCML